MCFVKYAFGLLKRVSKWRWAKGAIDTLLNRTRKSAPPLQRLEIAGIDVVSPCSSCTLDFPVKDLLAGLESGRHDVLSGVTGPRYLRAQRGIGNISRE